MGKGSVLLVNLLATWFLVGLIWVVQLVHYPLFAKVGGGEWDAYHRQHMQKITLIIAPVMFIEAISAAALVFVARDYARRARLCVWIAAALVLVNWFMTAAVAVPLHNALGKAFDAATVERLVQINWVRTIAWSLRGGLVAYAAWAVWIAPRDELAASRSAG